MSRLLPLRRNLLVMLLLLWFHFCHSGRIKVRRLSSLAKTVTSVLHLFAVNGIMSSFDKYRNMPDLSAILLIWMALAFCWRRPSGRRNRTATSQ